MLFRFEVPLHGLHLLHGFLHGSRQRGIHGLTAPGARLVHGIGAGLGRVWAFTIAIVEPFI